jgi:hypothetical protein
MVMTLVVLPDDGTLQRAASTNVMMTVSLWGLQQHAKLGGALAHIPECILAQLPELVANLLSSCSALV